MSGVHGIEEFRVALGLLQFTEQELNSVRGSHWIKDTPQHEHLSKIVFIDQEVLFPRSRFKDVHGWEDPFVYQSELWR